MANFNDMINERRSELLKRLQTSPDASFGISALKHLCKDAGGFACDDYSDEWEWAVAAWAKKKGLVDGWSGHTGHFSCRLTDKGLKAIAEAA